MKFATCANEPAKCVQIIDKLAILNFYRQTGGHRGNVPGV